MTINARRATFIHFTIVPVWYRTIAIEQKSTEVDDPVTFFPVSLPQRREGSFPTALIQYQIMWRQLTLHWLKKMTQQVYSIGKQKVEGEREEQKREIDWSNDIFSYRKKSQSKISYSGIMSYFFLNEKHSLLWQWPWVANVKDGLQRNSYSLRSIPLQSYIKQDLVKSCYHSKVK